MTSEVLEKAESGSRELDAAIAVMFAQDGAVRSVDPSPESIFPHVPGWCRDADDRSISALHYTTSLDAALELAERVLPGCLVTVGTNAYDGNPRGDAEVFLPIPNDFHQGQGDVSAATPALALCSAILKAARQAQGAGQ